MALELNKKKYLVLCVMVILLNYHINGAKAAESQVPQDGSKAEAPQNGSKAPGPASQASKNESKTQASQDPSDGSKAEAPQNGSKTPTSKVFNNGSKTPASQDPSNGSKAEAPKNGSKAPASQDSNNDSKTSASQNSKTGSKTPASQDPSNGSKAEAPKNDSKTPASQDSKNGSKTPASQDPSNGSKVEAPKNGSKTHASKVSNNGSKTHASQDSSNGSKVKAPKNGYKTHASQDSNNGSKTPASQDSKNGSKTPASQDPSNGSKAEAPKNGSKTPASQDSNNGSKTRASQDFKNGSKTYASQDSNNGSKTTEHQVPKNGKGGGEPQIFRNGTQGRGISVSGVGPQMPTDGSKSGQPQVPCYFIFGDSLVDAGNNNNLQTLAKADYNPYGIDFKPPGPTGRFSNGRTLVDIIAELLGFDHHIPPSEQTSGPKILQGVNFASAAAGIREETAQHLGDRITMSEQVENFRKKVGEVAGLVGGQKNATDYLGKCLYSVGLGSNDYLNNYFLPQIYQTSNLLTPEQYADELIKQYTTHLMAIYNLGARKFVLNGIGQVGCTPNSLATQGSPDGRTCVKKINDANEMFNTRLRSLVENLNKNHPDAKFTYVNAYGLFEEMMNKAPAYGFKVTNEGCCGIGQNRGLITCLPNQIPCPNRDEYLFWDAYHPTEATNIIGARRSYIKQTPSDAYPYDIHTLATL